MATLRNKRKLAAVTRETQEENPRNGQSRNTSVPRINEDYIAQVSEEIEGRVTKKLSQEYSRTESRILGALTKLDEFLSKQQIHTHFETVLGTFRSTNVENKGTNEDDSQSDPHPEAGIFRGQTTQNLGSNIVVTPTNACTSLLTSLFLVLITSMMHRPLISDLMVCDVEYFHLQSSGTFWAETAFLSLCRAVVTHV